MKDNRKIYTSVGVILFMMTLITIFAFRQEAQSKQELKEDPPTVVERGIMTEKQRQHSKLYEEETLSLQPSLIDKDGYTLYVTIFSGPVITKNNLKSKSEILQKLSCRADAVISGKIKSKTSQLTENQSFIFTDYEVEINEVIKNYLPSDLANAKTLTLTAAGGAVKSGDRVFKVSVERYAALLVNGNYIFFLRYLPDSQSFTLTAEQNVFEIFPAKNTVVFEKNNDENLSEDLETFLKSLRRTTSNGCSK